MTPSQIPRGTVARYADGLLTLTTPDGKRRRWDGQEYVEVSDG